MADETLRKTNRDKRLDALAEAVESYGKQKRKAMSDEVAFLKSVIDSRTGAGKLAHQGVADSTKLLADSISQFLEG